MDWAIYNIYTSASVLDLYGTTYNIAWIYDFKDDFGLYCDDSLIVLWKRNEQHIDKIRKNIKNAFKMIGFPTEMKTNSTKSFFLDKTFNLRNSADRPCKKPIVKLLHVHTLSSHPPQIIRELLISVNERWCNTSSNQPVFEYQVEITRCI